MLCDSAATGRCRTLIHCICQQCVRHAKQLFFLQSQYQSFVQFLNFSQVKFAQMPQRHKQRCNLTLNYLVSSSSHLVQRPLCFSLVFTICRHIRSIAPLHTQVGWCDAWQKSYYTTCQCKGNLNLFFTLYGKSTCWMPTWYQHALKLFVRLSQPHIISDQNIQEIQLIQYNCQ